MSLVIAELETKYTANDAELQAAGRRVLDLYERLKSAGSGLNTVSPAVQAAARDLQRMGQDATAAVAAVGKTQPAITGIATLEGRVAGLQTKLTGLAAKPYPVEVQAQITKAQEQLAPFQAQLKALTGQPATAQVRAEVAQAREQLTGLKNQVDALARTPLVITPQVNTNPALAALDRFRGVLAGVKSAAGGLMAGLGVFGLAAMGIQQIGQAAQMAGQALGVAFNARVENLTTAFSGLLGGVAQAQSYLQDLQQFAARTPFEFMDVARGAQRFMGMGLEARRVLPVLTDIGNAVAKVGGSSEEINRVEIAIGQIVAKGKVHAQEINQLAENGIAGWQILANHLHTTVAQVMADAEDSKISAETFLAAFHEANVGDAMAAQSRTFTGAMSTITDSVQIATASAFKPLFDEVSSGAQTVAAFVSSADFQSWAASTAADVRELVSILKEVGTDAQTAAQGLRPLADLVGTLGGAAKSAGVDFRDAAVFITEWLTGIKQLQIAEGVVRGAFTGIVNAFVDLRVQLGQLTAAQGAEQKAQWEAWASGTSAVVERGTQDTRAKLQALYGVAGPLGAQTGQTYTQGMGAAMDPTFIQQQVARLTGTLQAGEGPAKAAGSTNARSFMTAMLGDLTTGIPALDARIRVLLNRFDVQGAMALMGRQAAQAFATNLVNWGTQFMGQVATFFGNIPGLQDAAKTIQGMTDGLRKSFLVFSGDSTLPDPIKPVKEKVKKSAEDVAFSIDQMKERVLNGLSQAAQQSEPSAKGISESLVTLFNLTKDAAHAGMTSVHDSIVNLLAQANSKTPPTVQQIHDVIVRLLQDAAARGDQAMRLLAQNALDHLEEFQQKAADKVTKTQEKLSSETLKAQQTVVGNLRKMAEESASPTGQFSNVILGLMDVLKDQGTAKIAGLTGNVQGLLDQLLTDSPPTMDAVRTAIVGILDQMAQSSDVRVREMARSARAAFTEYQQAAADKLEKTRQEAEAKAAQIQQALVGAVGNAVTAIKGEGTNLPAALLQMLALAKAATDAGMGAVAQSLISNINLARTGSTQAVGQLNSQVLDLLQQMAASSDVTVSLMAQKLIAEFQNMAVEAATQTAKLAADTQANLEKARQSVVQGLEGAASATQDKSKTILDVITGLMPLLQQATDAGMSGVAETIQRWLAAAQAGTPPPMEEIYRTITSLLAQAQQSGDASLALFATQAQQHLAAAAAAAQQVTAIKSAVAALDTQIQGAEASLRPFQAAVDATKTGLDAASEAVRAAKEEVSGYQQQLRDAESALKDFTSAPLEGEGQFKEAQFANQQQQNALQFQINQMKMSGAGEAALKPLQTRLEALRLQQEQLRLQASLTFDPLHHQLEALNPQAKELTFQEAVQGAQQAKTQIAQFQNQLAGANKHVAAAEAAQKAAQVAVNAATQAYKEQEAAVKALVEQLKAQQAALQGGTALPGSPAPTGDPGTAPAPGQATAQGVGQGLAAAQAQTAQAATGMAQNVLVAMRQALGIAGPGAPATTTQSMGEMLGTSLGAGAQQSLTALPPAITTGMTAVTGAFQTGLAGIVPVWDSLFGPDAGKEGTLLNRLWGHQETSFFSVLTAYTRTKVQQWFDVNWTADLDELATKLTDYLRLKAGEVAVGGGEIGTQIIAGIAAALANTLPAEQAVRGAVQAILGAGEDEAKINSPSAEAADRLGAPIGQGIGVGIDALTPQVLDRMRALIRQTLGAGAAALDDASLRDLLGRIQSGGIGSIWQALTRTFGAAGGAFDANAVARLLGLLAPPPELQPLVPGAPGGLPGLPGGLPPLPGGGRLPPLPPVGPLPPLLPGTGGGGLAGGGLTIQVIVNGLTGDIRDPRTWDPAARAISVALQERGLIRAGGLV